MFVIKWQELGSPVFMFQCLLEGRVMKVVSKQSDAQMASLTATKYLCKCEKIKTI
jgi:hypothetical protein